MRTYATRGLVACVLVPHPPSMVVDHIPVVSILQDADTQDPWIPVYSIWSTYASHGLGCGPRVLSYDHLLYSTTRAVPSAAVALCVRPLLSVMQYHASGTLDMVPGPHSIWYLETLGICGSQVLLNP